MKSLKLAQRTRSERKGSGGGNAKHFRLINVHKSTSLCERSTRKWKNKKRQKAKKKNASFFFVTFFFEKCATHESYRCEHMEKRNGILKEFSLTFSSSSSSRVVMNQREEEESLPDKAKKRRKKWISFFWFSLIYQLHPISIRSSWRLRIFHENPLVCFNHLTRQARKKTHSGSTQKKKFDENFLLYLSQLTRFVC